MSDKGTQTNADIDQMAGRQNDEDDRQHEKVPARDPLEEYVLNVKRTVEQAPAGKLSEYDKRTVLDKCSETIKWLDANCLAEKEEFEKIYQFKITLKYIKPQIWRRIQVPEKYNFEDLHVAIQDAMGWENYHLHQFEIINPKTGQKDLISNVGIGMDDGAFPDVISVDKAKIVQYFPSTDKAIYEYDFGIGWKHKIVLEKILPVVVGSTYPQCLAGKRACPPEDCGGTYGYEDLLQIISNPNHEEYEERIEWLGGDFKPEEFDPKLVKFSKLEQASANQANKEEFEDRLQEVTRFCSPLMTKLQTASTATYQC